MEKLLSIFANTVSSLLPDNPISLYLYGSCTADDFRPGWSDIDFICFTETAPTKTQAETLLLVRQNLCDAHADPRFRQLEGVIVCLPEFQSNRYTRLLYYGTSGQRIRDHWQMDPFSLLSLHKNGRLLMGQDIRAQLPRPTFSELKDAIRFHLSTIRQYARETDDSLYSAGWLLDIARCLYTLQHQDIIPKTAAGHWALERRLCPEPDQMKKALRLRLSPSLFQTDPAIRPWLSSLGPSVQKFADVLESAMEEAE